jgi:hypothetical protein
MMRETTGRAFRWIGCVAVNAVVAACGGGGGDPGAGSGAAPLPSPSPDARNGTYMLMAADAREYGLALDFDANTYRVTGNGVDQSGTIAAQGDVFSFLPGNAVGATGASTTRFSLATNTVIGEFALPGGAVPFVAPRSFVNTLAGAVGTYNFLGRTVDTAAGGLPNTTIQQAEITADGHLRTCDDSTIFAIGSCPAASVTTGTVTVSGDLFTAVTASGNIPFRVAQVGADKVFLRASASTGTTRRFIVGVPAGSSFAVANFTGGTTEPAWGAVSLTAASFTSTGTSPAGVTTTQTGTASALVASGMGNVTAITTTAAGNFFATRTSELGVLVAGRNSSLAPGFMALGKVQ